MMFEQRREFRDEEIRPAISCFVATTDGTIFEGVIVDISDTGARIAGRNEGLSVGDEIEITLVVQSYQKVIYRCVVRHVDSEQGFCGIEFLSKPSLVKQNSSDGAASTKKYEDPSGTMRCPLDGKLFPRDYRFCPFDQAKLVCEV